MTKDELISKQAVLDALLAKMDEIDDKPEVVLGMAVAMGMIKAMPSALEQEPCEDCISREAAESLLKCGCGYEIYNLPSVQPKQMWISVSERLPEELEAVNITWVNHEPEPYYHDIKDKNFVATGIYYKGQWYWYSTTCADYLGEYGSNEFDKVDSAVEIVAWMPLPEPYKSEVDE